MAMFRTPLRVELLDARKGGIWELTSPLVYVSQVAREGTIVVPAGFVTDFASVPRLPVTYAMVGNQAHEAAVLHDWLYSRKCKYYTTREEADDVLYEAAVLQGMSRVRAYLMWLAVRTFGGQFWKAK